MVPPKAARYSRNRASPLSISSGCHRYRSFHVAHCFIQHAFHVSNVLLFPLATIPGVNEQTASISRVHTPNNELWLHEIHHYITGEHGHYNSVRPLRARDNIPKPRPCTWMLLGPIIRLWISIHTADLRGMKGAPTISNYTRSPRKCDFSLFVKNLRIKWKSS